MSNGVDIDYLPLAFGSKYRQAGVSALSGFLLGFPICRKYSSHLVGWFSDPIALPASLRKTCVKPKCLQPEHVAFGSLQVPAQNIMPSGVLAIRRASSGL